MNALIDLSKCREYMPINIGERSPSYLEPIENPYFNI